MEGSRLLFLSLVPVIALLISTQLQPVSAGGFIEIEFIKYMNPEGKGKNGHCCDGRWSFCSSECDHYFVICVDDVDTPNTTSPCKYNKTTTLPVKNKNVFDFKNVTEDIQLPNPLRIKLNPLEKDIALKIAVYDKDSTGSDDDVDFIRYDLGTGRNYLGIGEARTFNMTHRTTLQLKVRFGCDRDWYNDVCGQLCRPPSGGQHYRCDRQTGDKICDLGWEGPMCSTMSSRCNEDSCENSGTCTSRGNTQHCECSSEFTGARCEIDACDSKCKPGLCQRTGAGRDGYTCRCESGYEAKRGNQGEFCQLRAEERPRPTPRPDERPTPRPDERPNPRPDERPTPRPDERPTPRPEEPRPDERPTPRPTERPTPRPTYRPYPDEGNRLPDPSIPGPSRPDPGRPSPSERTDIIDCDTIGKKGYEYGTGLYNIQLGRSREKVMVYCEMKSSGGYTYIMHRGGRGRLDFYKGWHDYKEGFGEPGPDSEHWLGLEAMHLLTEQRRYKLRIDMKIASGRSYYAEYTDFKVGSEISKYRLHISGYRGTAGDALGLSEYDAATRASSHENMQFSTYEQDNDKWYQGNCARDFKSGWWFNKCYAANLNGQYKRDYDPYKPTACTDDACIQWRTIRDYQDFSLKEVTMKIIPY